MRLLYLYNRLTYRHEDAIESTRVIITGIGYGIAWRGCWYFNVEEIPMRNRGMREGKRGVVISLVAFLCATLTVILPIASYATQQSYTSYYCEVFYDDAGDPLIVGMAHDLMRGLKVCGGLAPLIG